MDIYKGNMDVRAFVPDWISCTRELSTIKVTLDFEHGTGTYIVDIAGALVLRVYVSKMNADVLCRGLGKSGQ
jgi:hypothetical protein